MAVEPSLSPSKFQELAKPKTPKTEVASNLAYTCCERADIFNKGADVMFHCCTQRHLGREGIYGLFNTGNFGVDHTHGFTDGLDVVVEIFDSMSEW